MIINKKEVARYLGYKNNKVDDSTKNLMDECEKEALNLAVFKFTYKRVALEFKNNEIIFSTIKSNSKSLIRNLKGCKEIIIFGATLGINLDKKINEYLIINPAKAVVLSAVCNALIEEYCDEKQNEIMSNLKMENKYLRPRFSPGYGDFKLEHQEEFVNILSAYKNLGVSITNGCMLVPSKTVTAVIGISDEEINCNIKGCEICTKKDCDFKRS